MFETIADLPVDPSRATVFELGWQSWSPAGSYPVTLSVSPRPRRPLWQVMAYRPEAAAPMLGFQSEGVLSVDPGDGGPIQGWVGARLPGEVPTIRAELDGARVRVSADGPVTHQSFPATGGHAGALAGVAAGVAAAMEVAPPPSLEPAWCSWYCHWAEVTATDVRSALAGIGRLELPVGVVQVDDGWQRGIGDWQVAGRFGSLHDTAAAVTATGRRAGIWLAPLLVGAGSELARQHPDWLVGDADGGHNWGQDLGVLDVTHPHAAEHLVSALRDLCALGFDFFKLDFLYAGAVPGRRHADAGGLDAYRAALHLFRLAVGGSATILGCGAPLLASVGLVDAMRVSPDVALRWEPLAGDLSQPGGRAAVLTTAARTALHGRWWVNDPDCILARPSVEHRERLAEMIEASGGLRCSSDRLDDLDAWGLATTRRLLRPSDPEPVVPVPSA